MPKHEDSLPHIIPSAKSDTIVRPQGVPKPTAPRLEFVGVIINRPWHYRVGKWKIRQGIIFVSHYESERTTVYE